MRAYPCAEAVAVRPRQSPAASHPDDFMPLLLLTERGARHVPVMAQAVSNGRGGPRITRTRWAADHTDYAEEANGSVVCVRIGMRNRPAPFVEKSGSRPVRPTDSSAARLKASRRSSVFVPGRRGRRNWRSSAPV